MKRLILTSLLWLAAAGAALAQTVGPPPIYCNRVYATTTLSASTTQLVAGVSGKVVNLCGFYVDGLAAGSLQLVFGTGTSCTSSTPASSVITTTSGQHNFVGPAPAYASGTSGQSLCAIVTGTNALTLTTYYGVY